MAVNTVDPGHRRGPDQEGDGRRRRARSSAAGLAGAHDPAGARRARVRGARRRRSRGRRRARARGDGGRREPRRAARGRASGRARTGARPTDGDRPQPPEGPDRIRRGPSESTERSGRPMRARPYGASGEMQRSALATTQAPAGRRAPRPGSRRSRVRPARARRRSRRLSRARRALPGTRLPPGAAHPARRGAPRATPCRRRFLKAYASLDRFEGRSSFYTWLYRLVINQCIDMRRREHARPAGRVAATATSIEDGAPARPRPRRRSSRSRAARSTRWRARSSASAWRAAIDTLPDATRDDAPAARGRRPLATPRSPRRSGIPRGTVMSRLHYARRQSAAGAARGRRALPRRGGRAMSRDDFDARARCLSATASCPGFARLRVERRLRRDPDAAAPARGARARWPRCCARSTPTGRRPTSGRAMRLRLPALDAARAEAADAPAARRGLGAGARLAAPARRPAAAAVAPRSSCASASRRSPRVARRRTGAVRWLDARGHPDDGAARRREATIIWVPERPPAERSRDSRPAARPRAARRCAVGWSEPRRWLRALLAAALVAAAPASAERDEGTDLVRLDITVLQVSDEPGEVDPRVERVRPAPARAGRLPEPRDPRRAPARGPGERGVDVRAPDRAQRSQLRPLDVDQDGHAPLPRRRGRPPGRLPRAPAGSPSSWAASGLGEDSLVLVVESR